MPYVQRDATRQIVGVFAHLQNPTQEWLEADSPELRTFVQSLKGEGSAEVLDKLAGSDQAIIRVLEDLVDTLISQNLIHFTDLPDAAQAKLLERRTLRRSVNALHLFRDVDQKLI
jgi:hypothetical protein